MFQGHDAPSRTCGVNEGARTRRCKQLLVQSWAAARRRPRPWPWCTCSAAWARLFGFLVDHTGSYRIAWLAAALAVLIGLLATLALRERRERRG